MRPVSGLDRPWIQWTLVALGVVLVVLVAAEAQDIRRTREQLAAARTAEMNARLDRTQLELELARERSAREALAIEAARVRGGAAPSGSMPPTPTLTLTPLGKRGAAPPSPSVDAPDREQVIELRLALPRTAPRGLQGFTIAMRAWSSGEVVWTRGGITRAPDDRSGQVAALIAGDALRPGAYEILLTARDAAGQPVEVATYEVSVAPASHAS